MDVLEWIHEPREGLSNGKQNTQLELGHSRYPVNEVILKIAHQINICRSHMAQYE